MPKLIIIRGNSGSGKTSLAHELQHKIGRNTMVISQDVIRREMLWVRDGPDTEAIPLLIELLRYGYAHSEITILEGILYSDIYKGVFKSAADLFGLNNIYAYYYNLPFEETLNRHQCKANRFDFGEKEMRNWWRDGDYIGFIPETLITKDTSLEENTASILTAVSQ